MRLPTTGKPEAVPVVVRPFSPSDSTAELTSLLHRAYAKQVAMGLKPLAGRQDEETTRRRCASGECFVATLADRIVGAILFEEVEEADFPPHFQRPEVAHFSLFAVDPELQGRGIGGMLLATVEERARVLGFTELALSMAEPDTDLARYYARRGFRFIEHWQWPYTNYRSAILSRTL